VILDVGCGDGRVLVILDVGCGDGRVLVTMAKILRCRGIGIDISQVRSATPTRE